MSAIRIDHAPAESRLNEIGVKAWPPGRCEISEFPWTYDSRETWYLLEGEVIVTPVGGGPGTIAAGDLVVFPAGMSCRWNVLHAVRERNRFPSAAEITEHGR